MSKSRFLLFSAVFFALIVAGCAKENKIETAVETNANANAFPSELVGTWKADQANWQFTFDENGNIAEFIHDFGALKLIPGIIRKNEMSDSNDIVCEPGQCFVEYLPLTKELSVYIEMKDISVGDVLKGKGLDTFVGTISEDFKTWEVQWYSDFNIYGFDANRGEKVTFPSDRPADVPMELTFTKQE